MERIERPDPLLWGHDMNDPFSNIGSVEAKRRPRSACERNVRSRTKAAQVYHRLVKGRRVGDMSFAYDVISSGEAEVDGEKSPNSMNSTCMGINCAYRCESKKPKFWPSNQTLARLPTV